MISKRFYRRNIWIARRITARRETNLYHNEVSHKKVKPPARKDAGQSCRRKAGERRIHPVLGGSRFSGFSPENRRSVSGHVLE